VRWNANRPSAARRRAVERRGAGRDAAIGKRGTVDDHHDAVDGDAIFDRRPMKCLHERLRQSEAGSLDHNMIDAVLGENSVKRRHEFVRDGAAQAAIGEFDNIVFRTGGIAACFENFAVNADVAKFIDNHGKPPALRISQNVPDQGRLSGAKEAGDDGAGHAREPRGDFAVHRSLSTKSIGGTRAIKARLRISGRPRHGRMPSLALARSFAPSISAPALTVSSPPKT